MNDVKILGRLTADPETKNVGGTDLTTGSIAYSKKYKDKNKETKEKTSFFEFKMWGRTGLAFAEYHSKGDLVLIEGELDQERWKTAEGENRSKTLINANRWHFVGGKKQPQAESQGKAHDPMDQANQDEYDGYDPNDDDIPF